MTDGRRGRAPFRFAIRRVRLVNFHNFVDETLEIREGGHLFLLGDNGSGKTTVLDAIHLALTGALDVELNAAARIAGARDSGRSLQGVVLRHDAERGVMNPGGATAYALIELEDAGEGALLCAGVGIEATTLEADVTRWAVLHRGPLEEVPIVESTPDGPVPVSRDALRAVLGKLEVFARMTDYRRALAERLFGGDSLYEEVCRFWTMAKAYREIVARSRDFSALFIRLLPSPDVVVFTEILRSIRALDELEVLIAELDRQKAYVAGLAAIVEEIRARREEVARYGWLLTFRRLAAAATENQQQHSKLEACQKDVERGAVRVAQAKAALDSAREALRAVSSSEGASLIDSLRQHEAVLGRDQGDLAVARHAAVTAEARSENRRRALEEALSAHAVRWRNKIDELSRGAQAARSLDHPLGAVDALISAEQALSSASLDLDDPKSLPDLDPEAIGETERLLAHADEALRARESMRDRRSADLERRRSELSRLASIEEEEPAVSGYRSARAALSEAGIGARPLFELLEPLPSAAEEDLATLEALIGDAGLAAFVVAEADLARARAQVLPHEGARVIMRAAPDAALPAWALALFTTKTPAKALDVLGTLLAQPASLGPVAAPDALGDVEHRGLAARVGTLKPRLIGRLARRRAHEHRLLAARQAVDEAVASLSRAESECSAAARGQKTALHVSRALADLRGPDLLGAHSTLERTFVEHASASERTRDAKSRLDAAELRCRETAAVVEGLRARVREAGADELERRLIELRQREAGAAASYERAVKEHAEAESTAQALRSAVTCGESEIERLRAELAMASMKLRAALRNPESELDDEGLERWVRVTQRGDQFTRLENIEERLRESERQDLVLCAELEGDGSRGTRNLEWAGRFGFSFSKDDLAIVDRRGDPLAGVLARIDRDLAEQREVVSDKTRELMDRLVMGDLARELQEQVERLYRTVKEMNQLLEELRFGTTRYQFRLTPRAETAELVGLVRKLSILDEASRAKFREFVDARLEELRRLDENTEIPELLDYRRWFDYRLTMRSAGSDDTELTREKRALGSGGEQGVPNYLLVLALAKLMFDNAEARVRPLLFDEAFYGIDAGRRDQLLRFATELELQLVVASPDQDGVTPSARRTTTLFIVRDEHGDVHLAPYHYWNDSAAAQPELFAVRAVEPDADTAVCSVGTAVGTSAESPAPELPVPLPTATDADGA